MFVIETPRLRLREMNETDAEFFFELNSDPDVIRFTGDNPFRTVHESTDFIQNYSDYQRFGMGRWIVELKLNQQRLGWCGLKYHPDEQFVDLGFRFLKREWGKGYATEASEGCILWAKEKGIKCLVGRAMKENEASIRVLSKLGFQSWVDLHTDLHDGVQGTLIL